jgi:hypothetical protein
VRVTWEALAIERDLLENPRTGIRRARGLAPEQKIVLVSRSHPAARTAHAGRASQGTKDGTKVCVLSDADMDLLVRGFRQIGFERVAEDTGMVASQFESGNARGRITVEASGKSRTVLSLRGQGQQDRYRDVPRIYSEAKQAIAQLRNTTPTLNVTTAGGQPMRPEEMPRMLRHGKSRVLTEEEAELALKGELPVAFPEDEESDEGGFPRR